MTDYSTLLKKTDQGLQVTQKLITDSIANYLELISELNKVTDSISEDTSLSPLNVSALSVEHSFIINSLHKEFKHKADTRNVYTKWKDYHKNMIKQMNENLLIEIIMDNTTVLQKIKRKIDDTTESQEEKKKDSLLKDLPPPKKRGSYLETRNKRQKVSAKKE